MKTVWKFSFILYFTLFLATGVKIQVSAQDSNPLAVTDDQVNEIARKLYCPVCENIPLDVCPTTACEEWRQLIREKIAEGWNEKQIIDYFVAQYGDRVIGVPPARGLNWSVYILPPTIILVGAILLIIALVIWRKQSKALPLPEVISNKTTPENDDMYIERMEEELKKIDRD
jgi:cytochrome c-type biogenesis protein CcmH